MSAQTFVLTWPVSTNDLWRAVRGRNILSAKAREWAKTASLELIAQRARPIKGRVAINIELSSPNYQPYDPDNRVKAVLDLHVKNLVIDSDNHRTVRRHVVEVCDDGSFTGARVTVASMEV